MWSVVTALKKLGFLLQWTDVRGLADPKRPRLVLMLPVGLSKPRLVIRARPLNGTCRVVTLDADAVARVAALTGNESYVGSLDDRPGLDNDCPQPKSTYYRTMATT